MSSNGNGTHPVSVAHLVMGLVFLGAAAVWALTELDLVELDGARWVVPLVLVVAGAVGLVASVGKGIGRRRAEARDTGEEETQVLG